MVRDIHQGYRRQRVPVYVKDIKNIRDMNKKRFIKNIVFGLLGSKGWSVLNLRKRLQRNDKLTIIAKCPP